MLVQARHGSNDIQSKII